MTRIYGAISALITAGNLWLLLLSDSPHPGDHLIFFGLALIGVFNLMNAVYGRRAAGVRLTTLGLNVLWSGVLLWVFGWEWGLVGPAAVVAALSVVLACRARGAVDTPRITNNTSSSGLLLRLAWACRAAALWFLAFSIWVAAAALWERRWFYEIEVLVATFLLGVPGLNLVNVLYAEGFAGLRWATASVNGATVAMACWWALLKPSMAWSVMLGYGLPGLLLSACSLVMTFSRTARLSSHDDAALRT